MASPAAVLQDLEVFVGQQKQPLCSKEWEYVDIVRFVTAVQRGDGPTVKKLRFDVKGFAEKSLNFPVSETGKLGSNSWYRS